jgi:hypothetical protein
MSLFTLIRSRYASCVPQEPGYEVLPQRPTPAECEFPLAEVQVCCWCRHPFFKDEQIITQSEKLYHGECLEQWTAYWKEIDRMIRILMGSGSPL